MDNTATSGSQKGTELLDDVGKAISGSDGTPPAAHN